MKNEYEQAAVNGEIRGIALSILGGPQAIDPNGTIGRIEKELADGSEWNIQQAKKLLKLLRNQITEIHAKVS